MTIRLWTAILLFIAASTVYSRSARPQAQAANETKPAAGSTAAKSAHPAHEEEGQRIFEANCSRCHATPEGFSSSISNTVVRHMRIRASLSAHDEQELRRFFNP